MSEQEGRTVAFADIPKDQRFSFKITPLPGRLLDLKTVGSSMAELAKFHASLGQDIEPNVKWKSCIIGCDLESDGSFRVDIAVLPTRKENTAEASALSDDRTAADANATGSVNP